MACVCIYGEMLVARSSRRTKNSNPSKESLRGLVSITRWMNSILPFVLSLISCVDRFFLVPSKFYLFCFWQFIASSLLTLWALRQSRRLILPRNWCISSTSYSPVSTASHRYWTNPYVWLYDIFRCTRFVVVLTEISPNENQDSWRLLLLHLWSTGGTAGSCCSLRLHGSGNDRRYQVSIMMERKRERGNQSTNAIDPSTAVRVAFRDRLHPARTTESAISLLTTAKHDRVELFPPLFQHDHL